MAFNDEPFRLFWRFNSDGGTFSASSTAEGYDVDNLQRDTLDKKWKSDGFGSDFQEIITVDLGSAQSITAFALLAHDLTANDSIVLRYASDAGFTADVGTVPVTFREDTLIEYFTAVSRRYWRLEIDLIGSSGSTTDTRQAGRLLLGDHYQTERNISLGWMGPNYTQDTTKSVRTAGGQKYADIGVAIKAFQGQFVALSETDLDEFEELKSTMLTGMAFIISQNWEDFPLKRTLYGTMLGMGSPINIAADKWTISFSMSEQK